MKPERPQRARHVEIQHDYINKDLNQLKEDIIKDVAAEDFLEWKLAYMWQLRDLRNTLTKHFDYEEESGFIREMTESAAGKRNRAVKLKNEHESMVGILDAIVADVKSMQRTDEFQLEEIRDRIAHFINTVHTHERAENRLIQQVYKQK